jgi:hypothetical protein
MVSQITLLALASSALALQITSPGMNTIWDLAKTNEIKWNAVNTDPSTFDIYLSHMASHPPTNTLLSANQNKDSGSFTVKDLQLPVGTTYQINFVAHDKPEQIYAQSQQFNTTGEAVAATSTLDGYTGPTYVPSGTKSGAAGAQSTAVGSGSSTAVSVTRSSITRTTLQVETTVSGSATLTRTTSATITEEADPSNSQVGAATTSAPGATQTPNAAVGNGASAPLAALVFGVAAFFL